MTDFSAGDGTWTGLDGVIHFTPEHPLYEESDDYLWNAYSDQEEAAWNAEEAERLADEEEIYDLEDSELGWSM